MKKIFKVNKSFTNEQNDRWTVLPNISEERSTSHRVYNGNGIKTTKYSIITFLPKNLFEQFHRFANIYFLFIIILNWIPQVNAFGKEIAMIPLIFVLAVTAVKDLIEDRQRYQSDKEINNRSCSVFRPTEKAFTQQKWHSVNVGDIIQINNDEVIPADVLILQSSDENGICHVSTANLDGENNLKQKQVPKGFIDSEEVDFAKKYNFQIQCEKPNSQINSFFGSIIFPDKDETGVDKNNILLRGCVLKNTGYVYAIVIYAGHDTKAMLNSSGPRYKRSQLEKDINKDVIACVFILLLFCLCGAVGCGVWTSDYENFEEVMSTNEAESPVNEGALRFLTFIIILQVIIPISLYVSVEIVKLGQVYFINNDEHFHYDSSRHFKVCRATNINEDLGQIKFVFSDKTGTLTENKMVFKQYSIAGLIGSYNADLQSNDNDSASRLMYEKFVQEKGKHKASMWNDFFTALTICNTVVVSSQPEVDDMTFETTVEAPLNQVNDMDAKSKRHSLDSHLRPPSLYKRTRLGTEVSAPQTIQYENEEINQQTSNYLQPISFQNKRYSKTQADRLSRSVESINSWLHYGLTPNYEYESPDEGALVKAAASFGYKLANRTPEQMFFTTPNGEIKIYDILHVLQFDSIRKRMSIIVRDNNGEIKVYCKGADSAILTQLATGQDDLQGITEEHLEEFAKKGLRTLCIAKKDLSQENYEKWLAMHQSAEVAIEDRDERLAESAELMETDLELLGVTGIEDRLQDGVADTIASLRHAGIKVWILTGDKQETAVNIGFSCKLIDDSMELITMNTASKSECNDLLDEIINRLQSNWPTLVISPTHSLSSTTNNSGRPPLALIIDGRTLAYALEPPCDKKFVEISKQCESVICCRAAPLQKAAVVKLIRENLKSMSLAIGDGANDVSMLQMAEVGVGITGEEGMQAVMASDFVLARFRFLRQLLLLHGFWCYDRIARMIVYFFYKNSMFVALLFWYQLFNGFSGSNAVDDISLILYNLAFTSLPPIIGGIFDQNIPSEHILKHPLLYRWGQSGKAYSRKLFWISIFDAVYQSLVLFFIPYFTLYKYSYGMISIGILYHQLAVITATLHIALETPNWTWIHVGFMLGSVVVSFIYFFIYCLVSPLFNVYWVIFEIMETSEFWFLLLITPLVALLPRLLYKTIQGTFKPSVIQIVKQRAVKHIESESPLQNLSSPVTPQIHTERQISTPT